jgi:hypothetical protein
MPEKKTLERARRDRRQGKRPTTQAGEFIREEIHHIRSGEHGARSTKQAIAIGLSKARRAGVKLGPAPGTSRTKTHTKATGSRRRKPSRSRSRATTKALKRESRQAASPAALARHARQVARRRGPAARRASARKAAATRKAA